MTSASRPMNAREWTLLIFLSVLWGASYLFIGVAAHALPPATLAAARVGLAACGLLVMLRFAGGRFAPMSAWPALFGMGILNNVVPFTLLAWSQARIPSGLAAILAATTPLFTVLVAHFATDNEKLTWNRGLGIVVGIGGVALMIGLEALEAIQTDILAEAAVLLAAFFYALSAVYGRRFSRMGLAPLTTASGQISAAAIMLVPLALIFEQPWQLPTPGLAVVASMIGLAFLSTSLAYLVFFRILATAGATNLMLVTLLIPVSAILFGALLLHERLDASHFAGMVLIAAGLALIDGRLIRRFRRAPA